MGWSSANEIFDPTAQAVIEKHTANGLDDEQATDILVALIKQLQAGDWDTEDESLEQFEDYPFVVAAFAQCGINVRVDLEDEGSVAKIVRSHLGFIPNSQKKSDAIDAIAAQIVQAYEDR